MTNEQLKASILEGLKKKYSLASLHTILVEYKNLGGKQKAAYDTMEELRYFVQDDDEDKILELMDFISGFCSAHMLIW